MNRKQFVDEKTGTVIYAELDNSVIHNTMRPQDLIPAFLDVIVGTPEYIQLMVDHQIPPSSVLEDDKNEWWESQECMWFLHETLLDILNSYAPNGYLFGSHIGNGSDFGYWKI